MNNVLIGFPKEIQDKLANALNLKIISPYIKESVAKEIIKGKNEDVKIITKLNFNNYESGSSDLNALRYFNKMKCKVKGFINGLHSKLYIINEKVVIITSANWTNSGFNTNLEFGYITDNKKNVRESLMYFNGLWNSQDSIEFNEN